ncbi:MAG: hypothetical protein JWO80_4945 [Bryobacterales bacterium]|nr:hypothetical protein [Bryobacterales bacterium]
MTVEAIKEAITELSEDERTSLAAWLVEMDYDEWDREMVKDLAPGGRGRAFLDQVQHEIAEGKARPIEEGFAGRRHPRT